MAELKLIIVKDKTTRTAKSPMLVEGVAPQASPIMSDPRFGSRNSALEIVPSDLTVSNMILSTRIEHRRIKNMWFEAAKGILS
jgi:hypothetical protein